MSPLLLFLLAVASSRKLARCSRPAGLCKDAGKVLKHQNDWPQASLNALCRTGYTMKLGGSATFSGVALENGK